VFYDFVQSPKANTEITPPVMLRQNPPHPFENVIN
jgi:hypothetical protein